MEIKRNMVRVIDAVIIVGSVIALIMVMRYAQPMVIAPSGRFNTTKGTVLFEFANADKILIDDNANFTSPDEIYAEDNLEVNLKPGHYYWKIVGLTQSETREFTVESEVNLKMKKQSDGKYELVNSGNSALNVDVYDKGKFTGSVVLDVDESKNVSGTKFIAQSGGARG